MLCSWAGGAAGQGRAASDEIDYPELPTGGKIFLSSKNFVPFGKGNLKNMAIESRCLVNKIC
jgi:hypothetical protein